MYRIKILTNIDERVGAVQKDYDSNRTASCRDICKAIVLPFEMLAWAGRQVLGYSIEDIKRNRKH